MLWQRPVSSAHARQCLSPTTAQFVRGPLTCECRAHLLNHFCHSSWCKVLQDRHKTHKGNSLCSTYNQPLVIPAMLKSVPQRRAQVMAHNLASTQACCVGPAHGTHRWFKKAKKRQNAFLMLLSYGRQRAASQAAVQYMAHCWEGETGLVLALNCTAHTVTLCLLRHTVSSNSCT